MKEDDSLKTWNIGKHEIKNQVILAPMAGVTDLPYRNIHLQQGIAYTVSEMVLANEQMLEQGHTLDILQLQHVKDFLQHDNLRCIQLLGHDPYTMGLLAKLISDNELADIIDINLGCPAKKVVKKAAGSALMAYPEQVQAILQAVYNNAANIPVTVKMRTGIDIMQRNVLQLATMAQDIGLKAVTIHGRTRADLFNGHAEYDTIAQVKTALEIPVIANGDIDSVAKFAYVMNKTKADAVMIGRASQGNPWLLGEIVAYSQRKEYIPVCTLDKFATVITHIQAIHNYYPEIVSVRIARKHWIWYLETIFPIIYKKKTRNNLEKEQDLAIEKDFQLFLEKQYFSLLTPKIVDELSLNINNTIAIQEEISKWKRYFIALKTVEEQQNFMDLCYQSLIKWK